MNKRQARYLALVWAVDALGTAVMGGDGMEGIGESDWGKVNKEQEKIIAMLDSKKGRLPISAHKKEAVG